MTDPILNLENRMPDQTPEPLTREHLETFVFDPHRAAERNVVAMARELLAARARITELSDGQGDLIRKLSKASARVAELETEHNPAECFHCDRCRDADDIADQFGIQGLASKDGVTTLTTKPTTEEARELVLAMSLACGRMLDDDQAPNYVEFEVSPAGHPGYIVHVRRAGGRSPHSLRLEAEKRAERTEAVVERVRAVLNAAETETPDDWGLTYVYTSRLRKAIEGTDTDE